jgi:hypothetical protein
MPSPLRPVVDSLWGEDGPRIASDDVLVAVNLLLAHRQYRRAEHVLRLVPVDKREKIARDLFLTFCEKDTTDVARWVVDAFPDLPVATYRYGCEGGEAADAFATTLVTL